MGPGISAVTTSSSTSFGFQDGRYNKCSKNFTMSMLCVELVLSPIVIRALNIKSQCLNHVSYMLKLRNNNLNSLFIDEKY